MKPSLLPSLLATVALAAPLHAQTCPPNVLCPQGTTCAPIVCPINARSYTVSGTSALSAPPVTGEIVRVPRFSGSAGQTLLEAEVIVRATLGGAVRVQNTGTAPIGVQSHLGTSFSFDALLPQLDNLAIQVATPVFDDQLGPNVDPPCSYGASDSAQHLHLSVTRERRACITDPTLLAALFTNTSSLHTLDFVLATLDTSSSNAPGACVVLTNLSRAEVTVVYHYCTGGTLGTPLCAGSASSPTPCPCANTGLDGQGCANSFNAAGASLAGNGVTSPDTVTLVANGETHNALSIFLQGNALAPGAVFGDGVRCASGALKRLYVKSAVGGMVSAPSLSDAGIRFLSGTLGDPIANGSTRWYQVYYRDSNGGFCPPPAGGTFNVTNALAILWL